MLTLLNSSKKLVLHTPAELDAVWDSLGARVKAEPDPFQLIDLGSVSVGNYLGKRDGRDLVVRYVSGVKNSLQPTMHIHVEAAMAGGTVVLTRFSTSTFVKVFLLMWMLGASVPTIFSIAHRSPVPGDAAIFPLFGVFLVIVMRVFARKDEVELERMVRGAIADAESGGQGRMRQ
jgi:hypothetical protein